MVRKRSKISPKKTKITFLNSIVLVLYDAVEIIEKIVKGLGLIFMRAGAAIDKMQVADKNEHLLPLPSPFL